MTNVAQSDATDHILGYVDSPLKKKMNILGKLFQLNKTLIILNRQDVG